MIGFTALLATTFLEQEEKTFTTNELHDIFYKTLDIEPSLTKASELLGWNVVQVNEFLYGGSERTGSQLADDILSHGQRTYSQTNKVNGNHGR